MREKVFPKIYGDSRSAVFQHFRVLRGAAMLLCALIVFALQPGNRVTAQTERLRVRHDLGGDFTLTTHHGEKAGLQDYRGQVVLLYFGYTTCPDVCPMTLSHLKMAISRLGERAEKVQVLFVTIDPERDTPERLRDYVPFFHTNFIGLTGTPDEITKTAELYRVQYFREASPSAAGYFMAHTDAVFLVDQYGRYRGRYQTKWALEDLQTDIRLLLASGS